MKNCATCIWHKKACEGECDTCEHKIIDKEDKKDSFGIVSYGISCKCFYCFSEDSGRFKYWEENKEMTRLLGEGDDEDEEV